jgi:hypothetical protein
MDTEKLQEIIMDLMYNSDEITDAGLKQIRSFREAGLLTRDEGLVLRLTDGSEFLITINQSRGGDAK